MDQATNFWQANGWGIVGTISGIIGLFVSWVNFKYNTPKIEIEETQLIVPDWIVRDWKDRSVQELKGHFLDFELEIIIRNTRGGSGSISKPLLLIMIPNGKKIGFFWKYKKSFLIDPTTEYYESERESETLWKTWTERQGRSFNLEGGRRVDDKLKYTTSNPDFIYEYINNFRIVHYFIVYIDNSGERKKIPIDQVFYESSMHT